MIRSDNKVLYQRQVFPTWGTKTMQHAASAACRVTMAELVTLAVLGRHSRSQWVQPCRRCGAKMCLNIGVTLLHTVLSRSWAACACAGCGQPLFKQFQGSQNRT